MLLNISEFHSFLRLNNIALNAHTVFSLSSWTSRLCSHLGYPERHWSEHGSAKISSRSWLHFFWINTRRWDGWSTVCFWGFQETSHCFHKCCTISCLPTGCKCSVCSTSLPTLVLFLAAAGAGGKPFFFDSSHPHRWLTHEIIARTGIMELSPCVFL